MVDVAVGSGQQSFTRQRAGSRSSLRKWVSAQIVGGVPDDTAADRADRRFRHLSGVLRDVSRDIEQVDDEVRRLVNFQYLFKRETFWMVVQQSCVFALTAVIFKALIGFIGAHFVHNVPTNKQRRWRGILLIRGSSRRR